MNPGHLIDLSFQVECGKACPIFIVSLYQTVNAKPSSFLVQIYFGVLRCQEEVLWPLIKRKELHLHKADIYNVKAEWLATQATNWEWRLFFLWDWNGYVGNCRFGWRSSYQKADPREKACAEEEYWRFPQNCWFLEISSSAESARADKHGHQALPKSVQGQ